MSEERLPEYRRCEAVVWKRDTWRRTGRGKSGFEMHYIKRRCSRMAINESGLCQQHLEIAKSGSLLRVVRNAAIDHRLLPHDEAAAQLAREFLAAHRSA